ncbi:MAG: hypothetical protein J6B57_01115 [Oscillospiraceae bacterium]|nr:hypothetical protein [Oscillospiraceae bacterium]
MSEKKTHTMKQDAELVRSNTRDKDVHLHNELHPNDRKSGKGAKESKQFHDNCNFNLNHTK